MSLKILSAVALATSLMAGTAFAQTPTDGTENPNQEQANPLMEQEFMGGFYTDDTRTALLEGDELTAAWEGLTAEDQEMVRTECANVMEEENPNQEQAQSDSFHMLCAEVSTW